MVFSCIGTIKVVTQNAKAPSGILGHVSSRKVCPSHDGQQLSQWSNDPHSNDPRHHLNVERLYSLSYFKQSLCHIISLSQLCFCTILKRKGGFRGRYAGYLFNKITKNHIHGQKTK
jgi:hypothetical protein